MPTAQQINDGFKYATPDRGRLYNLMRGGDEGSSPGPVAVTRNPDKKADREAQEAILREFYGFEEEERDRYIRTHALHPDQDPYTLDPLDPMEID